MFIYCVTTNHKQDPQQQKPQKTAAFSLVTEQNLICFVTKGLKINPIFGCTKIRYKLTVFTAYLNTSQGKKVLGYF